MIRRGLLLLSLAGLSFAAVAALVHRQVPWPSEHGLAEKVEYFLAHQDRFDAVYLGSSMVFRSVMPAVVDAELARRGHPLHSFNLGCPGMIFFEADHLLRILLDRAASRLKVVVLEPQDFSVLATDPARIFNARSAFWHDPRQTIAALALLRGAIDQPLSLRLNSARYHLMLAAWNLTSYGLGPRIVGSWLGRHPGGPFLSPAELEAGGFQALDDRPEAQERMLRFRSQAGEWLASVRLRAQLPRLDDLPAPPEVRARLLRKFGRNPLAGQIEAVRAAGAEPVYMVPPRAGGDRLPLFLRRAGFAPDLLAFDDPRDHPELFRLELFFDLEHLNRRGAEQFSRVFAAALADHLDRRHDG